MLEGLEAVRKRPGMYIGSTDGRGLMHCLWEIIDNAVDEALGGHCSRIDVLLRAETGLPVMVCENPQLAVVLGTGRVLDELSLLREIALK